MKAEFHSMQKIPKQATDLNGNIEPFSVAVLVYDDTEHPFCEIGHYNFDTGTWSHFGEGSMHLICWCYLPDPTEFRRNNPDLKSVIHEGYRP
jgi:hypothetical protein